MTCERVISLSELQKAQKGFPSDYHRTHPLEFSKILFDLGLNTDIPVEFQEGVTHRNAFGEVVTCDRWVGLERLDREWIESGHATRKARLEASGSRLVMDLDPNRYVEF